MGNTPAQKNTIKLMQADSKSLSLGDKLKKHEIDKHVEAGNKEISKENKQPLKPYQALAKAKAKKAKATKDEKVSVSEGTKKAISNPVFGGSNAFVSKFGKK